MLFMHVVVLFVVLYSLILLEKFSVQKGIHWRGSRKTQGREWRCLVVVQWETSRRSVCIYYTSAHT